jgi:selenocysteine lyase/cysteine desulfurase
VAVAFLVTANFTEDGHVAWRRADGTWARRVDEAGPVDEAAAARAAAAAQVHEQREVSNPYVIEIELADGAITLLTARERIRAHGPTIRVRRPDGG